MKTSLKFLKIIVISLIIFSFILSTGCTASIDSQPVTGQLSIPTPNITKINIHKITTDIETNVKSTISDISKMALNP